MTTSNYNLFVIQNTHCTCTFDFHPQVLDVECLRNCSYWEIVWLVKKFYTSHLFTWLILLVFTTVCVTYLWIKYSTWHVLCCNILNTEIGRQKLRIYTEMRPVERLQHKWSVASKDYQYDTGKGYNNNKDKIILHT